MIKFTFGDVQDSKIEHVTIEEMQSAVEDYIFDKKGKRVTINILSVHPLMIHDQYVKLNLAYNVVLAG